MRGVQLPEGGQSKSHMYTQGRRPHIIHTAHILSPVSKFWVPWPQRKVKSFRFFIFLLPGGSCSPLWVSQHEQSLPWDHLLSLWSSAVGGRAAMVSHRHLYLAARLNLLCKCHRNFGNCSRDEDISFFSKKIKQLGYIWVERISWYSTISSHSQPRCRSGWSCRIQESFTISCSVAVSVEWVWD